MFSILLRGEEMKARFITRDCKEEEHRSPSLGQEECSCVPFLFFVSGKKGDGAPAFGGRKRIRALTLFR